MEIWGALIALVGGAIGSFLRLLPGLTVDDRECQSILRDSELFHLLPKGRASEEMKQYIEKSVLDLLEERERKKREKPWGIVVLALVISPVAAAGITYVSEEGLWPLVHGVLLGVSLGSLGIGIIVPLVAFVRFIRRSRFANQLRGKMRIFFNKFASQRWQG